MLRNPNSRFFERVLTAIKIGLGFGVLFSAWVALITLIGGPEALRRYHVGLAELVAFYLGSGLVIGGIVGVLQPLTKTKLGAAVLGIIACFPMSIALQYTLHGWYWDSNAKITTAIVTLVFGIGGGLIMKEIFDEP